MGGHFGGREGIERQGEAEDNCRREEEGITGKGQEDVETLQAVSGTRSLIWISEWEGSARLRPTRDRRGR